MTETAPDNPKKRKQFVWTSAINLIFLILLAVYVRFLMQPGISPMPTNGNTPDAELPQLMYVIAPPAFGLVGLLLALAWKPLRRGIIVLLALHYILMMSIVLLVGYADITLLFGQQGAGPLDIIILVGILAVLVFLFFWNIKSHKDLDLPSIFGKR